MNIENELNEIADYFKEKIISGEFTFKKCDEHKATILIDEKYELGLWIANEPKNNFDFYAPFPFLEIIGEDRTMFKFNTQKERLAGWKQIKPHVIKYKKGKLLKEKREELRKLESEIEKFS